VESLAGLLGQPCSGPAHRFGEAAIEHLIDANPDFNKLVLYLALLKTARLDRIEAAYEEFGPE
jgi:hypothetical protein